jgi:hypothetical protein
MPASLTPLRRARQCPECGTPSSREHYPFCSARCKSLDLGRWLSGSYVIAAREGGQADPDDGQEN